MNKEDVELKKQTEDGSHFHWFMENSTHEWFAYFTKAFNDEEIDLINKLGESCSFMKAQIASKEKLDLKTRDTDISWIPVSSESEWLFRRLVDLSNEINKRYFNFELHTIQNLQYSVYNKGGHYNDHVDISFHTPMGCRKLSFSLLLNDPAEYKGGNLELITGEKPMQVPQEKGTIVFFPSYTLHRVTPVTKGTRKALVSWILGPNFK